MFQGRGLPITERAIAKASDHLDIDGPRFWAVMSVESRGFGFLKDRRPKILFERHVFHRETAGRFSSDHPDISNKKAGGYGAGGANQYARLERAIALDREAALKSASWGVGQVMGFNAEIAGFSGVEDMVKEMMASEDAQMLGMFNFIKHHKLEKYLKNGDWEGFAKRYNGSGYKKNKYHTKLEIAFNKYLLHPPPNITVRTVQTCLTYLNYDPKGIDGIFGDNSQRALMRYEKAVGLPVDGRIDDTVVKRLLADAFG